MATPETLLFCLGNPDRGDDAAGTLVAAALSRIPGLLGVYADIVEDFQLQPEHVEDVAGYERCIIVDAALEAPWPPRLTSIPTPLLPGPFSHALAPAQLAWLYERRYPGRRLNLHTLGIPAHEFGLGAPPGDHLREAVSEAVKLLIQELLPASVSDSTGGSFLHA